MPANVLSQLRTISVIEDNLKKAFSCFIFLYLCSFTPNLCFQSSFIFPSCLAVRLGEHEPRHNKVFSSPAVQTLQTGIQEHGDPALAPQGAAPVGEEVCFGSDTAWSRAGNGPTQEEKSVSCDQNLKKGLIYRSQMDDRR